MKMKPEHYKELSNALDAALTNAKMTLQQFIDRYKASCLSMERMRWDLFYHIPNPLRCILMDKLYQYLNDDHVDTALRKYTHTK